MQASRRAKEMDFQPVREQPDVGTALFANSLRVRQRTRPHDALCLGMYVGAPTDIRCSPKLYAIRTRLRIELSPAASIGAKAILVVAQTNQGVLK